MLAHNDGRGVSLRAIILTLAVAAGAVAIWRFSEDARRSPAEDSQALAAARDFEREQRARGLAPAEPPPLTPVEPPR